MIRVCTLRYLNSSSIEPSPARATSSVPPCRRIEFKLMAQVATSGILPIGKFPLLRAIFLSGSIGASSRSVSDLKSLATVESCSHARMAFDIGKYYGAIIDAFAKVMPLLHDPYSGR